MPVHFSVATAAIAVLSVLCGGTAWAAGELERIGPEPVVLSVAESLEVRVFAKQTVKILSAEILYLIDQATGQSADPERLMVVPKEHDIEAGAFTKVRIDIKPGFDTRRTFEGQIGIRYQVGQSAPAQELFTWRFTLLGRGVSGLGTAKDATLEFVTSSGAPVISKRQIRPNEIFSVCLLAKITAISVIQSQVGVVDLLDTVGNVPMEPGAVSVVSKPPATIRLGEPACLELKQGESLGVATKVTGTLVVPYRVPTATAEIKRTLWTFELSQPAVSVSVGLNGSFTVSDVRPWPLTDHRVQRCVPYMISPARQLLGKHPLQAEIYVDRARPDYPERATIAATPADDRHICIDAMIPSGLTSLKGKIRLVPPDVSQAADLSPVFQIKDHWSWRLLTAILAYALAFVVYFLTTGVRARLQHRATRASISLRVERFLGANPAFVGHDAVVFVRQLLSDSDQQDRRGDFETAAATLSSADGRMTQLETSPPAAPTPVTAGPLEIRVLDPPERLVSGRRISFQIGNPPAQWTSGSVYTWKIGQAAEALEVVGADKDLTSLRHSFPSSKAPVNWIIEVDANGVSKSRTITLAADNRKLSQRLLALNLAPQLLAMSLAALAAYVATNAVESWGTPSDYVNLFLTALGVSAGTQSLAVLIQAFRR